MIKLTLRRLLWILVFIVFVAFCYSIKWMGSNLDRRVQPVHFDAFAVSPNGQNLYVFDRTSGSASIIAVASKTKVDTLPINGEVSSMVFNANGSKAYILANLGENGGEISEVDVATNTIRSVISTVRFTHGSLSISLDDSKLHLALGNQTDVSLLTIDNHKKDFVSSPVKFENVQLPILFSKDGSRLFITSNILSGECELLVVDTSTYLTLNQVVIGKQCPSGLAISENGEKLAASLNGSRGQVVLLDSHNFGVAEPINVRAYPESLSFSKVGAAVYVLNTGNDHLEGASLSKVDTRLNSVVAEIPIKSHPRYLAVSPDGKKVFLLGAQDGQDSKRVIGHITIVDSESNTITEIIPIKSNIGTYLKMQMWDLASWVQKNIFRDNNQPI